MAEDFFEPMLPGELSRLIADLAHQYGVTDAEMEQWRRLSHAERMQQLRELEEKMRRWNEGKGPDAERPG